MIRVAIVDDHPEMRVALRMLIRLSKNMDLVGEMINGQEAVDCAADLQPDVLVMDINMPVLDGLAATRRIMDLTVRTRVILISSYTGSSITMQAIAAGAKGFVPKDDVAAFLLLAIESVHQGDIFF